MATPLKCMCRGRVIKLGLMLFRAMRRLAGRTLAASLLASVRMGIRSILSMRTVTGTVGLMPPPEGCERGEVIVVVSLSTGTF